MQAYGRQSRYEQGKRGTPHFRRLAEVAERTGCAFILIGHLNKGAGGQSAYRA
ncbi:MAG: hypothetical protein ACLRZ9_13150 [Eubacterium sp.]